MFSRNWKLVDNRGTTDPAVNLALEEYTVRHGHPTFSYFFMYVNRPSVVLGRHQNVLGEVNLRVCWQDDIPVIRRISGGGTVVHDSGNLNFSFITDHSARNFNRYRQFLEPIVRVLRKLGAPVHIDERNNLVINTQKVSGNAQFTSRGRMLSHGTLLFKADLLRMRRLLERPHRLRIETRATRSVKAEVTNIVPYLTVKISIADLKRALLSEILGTGGAVLRYSEKEWQMIERLAEEKYRSFAWNIGESPQARIRVHIRTTRSDPEIDYRLREGRLRQVTINDPASDILAPLLEGQLLTKATFDAARLYMRRYGDGQLKEKAICLLQNMI